LALSFVGSAATLAAFVATEGAGGTGWHRARSDRPQRSEGWRSAGYFGSRCKAPAGRDGK